MMNTSAKRERVHLYCSPTTECTRLHFGLYSRSLRGLLPADVLVAVAAAVVGGELLEPVE